MLVDKILKIHKLGSHCTTAAMHDILAYAGADYSEDLCFGLGCGLGFSYYKIPDMPLYSFNGRTRYLERMLCSIIGVEYEIFPEISNDEMWNLFVYASNNNIPLLLSLDWNHIDYLVQRFRGAITDKILLAEHNNILVRASDKDACFVEYFSNKLHVIPRDTLLMALNSKIEKKAIANLFYFFHIPEAFIEISIALINAIYYNMHDMLFGFGSNFGLTGMKKFFAEFLRWPDIMSSDEFKRNCIMAFTSFEKWGNGGGNFRLMYSRFLKAASEILKDKVLLEIANAYGDLSRNWKLFSHLLEEISQKDNFDGIQLKETFGSLCDTILKQETQNIDFLYNWSLTRCK